MRERFAVKAAAATSFVCVLFAHAALAQDPPPRLFGWNEDANAFECTLSIACDEEECPGGLMCVLDPDIVDYCSVTKYGETDARCCPVGGDAYCKLHGAEGELDGVCATIVDDEDDENPVTYHVCAYPGVFDYCADEPGAPTFEEVQDCFMAPAAGKGPIAPTNDWRLGDCDQDGIENKVDCCPCDHDCDLVPPLCNEPGVDAGVPDAGVDAGVDAGEDELDGAVAEDGAPTPPRPNYSFRGDGGCKCDLAAPRSNRGQLGLGLLLLCVWIARRAFSRSGTD